MNCDSVRNEIKAYIDGEAGRLAEWRIRRHLAGCASCRMEEKAMAELTGEVQRVDSTPAPAGLRQRVLGSVDLLPAARRKWVLARRPVLVGGGVVVVAVVVLAIVSPSLYQAREVARKEVGAPAATRVATEPMAPDTRYTGGARSQPEFARPAPLWGGPQPASKSADRFAAGGKASSVPSPASTPFEPQIIKTAEITVKVKSVDKAYDEAVLIAASVGGYVTNSSASTGEAETSSGTLTIRVPVAGFERALAQIGKLGIVRSRNVTGQDVSGQVVDLESRIRNKRAEEQQYLQLMSRSSRTGDILAVSGELSRVRGEIEEMVGRLKYLQSAAAMATINLRLTETEPKKAAKPGAGTWFHDTFGEAWDSVSGTARVFGTIGLWLLVYSPFWGVPLWFALRMRKRATAAE